MSTAKKDLEAYWETTKDRSNVRTAFDTDFPVREFPILWLLLSTTKRTSDDRTGFSITIFKDKDAFKVLLTDKIESQAAFITIDTLEDILVTVEGHLTDGTVDWRKNRDSR